MTGWVLAGALLYGQFGGQLGGLDAPPRKSKQFVVYVAEEQTVAAGKRAVLELRFVVQGGFHVNSHLPKSELQIPTKVELGPDAGVKVLGAEYPVGKSYHVAADPTETLNVYSESFVVKVPVVAGAGQHALKGSLTYQACDTAACYPPKTLALDVLFTAK